MKIKFLCVMLSLMLLNESCQKCELIDQDIVFPPQTCEGVYYINKVALDSDDFTFFLNEFNRPTPNPFIYAEGTGPHLVPTFSSFFEYNFSALDTVNNEYVFEYYYEHGGPAELLFFHQDMNTGAFTISAPPYIYASPAFLKNRLFAIKSTSVFEDVTYEVIELNPVNGNQLGVITSGTFFANSPFSERTMSSISNGEDKVYFLSGTNMVEANISQGTSRHIVVDPTYDPIDNNVTYYGIEFKDDTDNILAMVTFQDAIVGSFTDLVVMNISNSPAILDSYFNIAGQLPLENDKVINPDYYSTTFDQCANTYYITELHNEFMTNLIEINLDSSELKIQTIQDKWYGVELYFFQ